MGTLPRNDHTARMPFEMLEHIFCCADETDDIDIVLDWAHVCRRWRAVALQQPAFARRIVWNYHETNHWSSRLADAAFLRDRLQASAKPLEFDLFIKDSDPSFIYDTLLPALSMELHRVRILRVIFNRRAYSSVMRALLRPAPILCDLRICHNWSAGEILVLAPPTDHLLLDGHAPSLTYLHLSGMELPSSLTPAFNSVKHLSLHFSVGFYWTMPQNLAHLSPGLRHLSLLISESTLNVSSLVPPTFPLTLDSLSLISDNIPLQSLSMIVSSKTRYLQVGAYRAPHLVVPYLFDQFPSESGLLHAFFTFDSDGDEAVDLCLHHPESDLRRSIGFEGHWTLYEYRHVFPSALETRIVELTVEANLFGVFAALFPCLPVLRTLVLTGGSSLSDEDIEDEDEDEDAVWPTGTEELPPPPLTWHGSLRCASLSKLVLAATTHRTVFLGADSLIAFTEDALGQTAPAAVELELRNVLLYGESSRLLRMFSCIRTVPGVFEQPDVRGDRFKGY